MTAVATQPLREFSLDFQGFTISALTVNGAPATTSRDGTKLIIDPATPLTEGQTFKVAVTYSGTPPTITDEDGSDEGFLQTPDGGAMVVCEPVGSMGWYPNNDTPQDKATYDISLTVPPGFTVMANGVLVSSDVGATGQTWHWRESEPMASYLSTATLAVMQTTHSTHDGISIDVGVAAGYVPLTLADDTLTRIPEILDLYKGLYGPYPFSEAGAIVGVNPAVGYALETQTKPNFPLPPDFVTLAHETSHQYWGDSVSIAQWRDIWLNEGFATWSEWVADARLDGGSSLESHFQTVYGGKSWTLPPANPGSGANIFASAVYNRGGATLEGLREIVGEPTFLTILRTWFTQQRDRGDASTAKFIALAKQLGGVDQDRLGEYFQQWLYGTTKPTITPANF
jgi:aminopeptidase N